MQAPCNFEQQCRPVGRTRSNKDVEQAVEQGSSKVKKRVLVEEKSITNKVVEQGSNKDVEQGVEQGRTSDGRSRSRTRMSNNDLLD